MAGRVEVYKLTEQVNLVADAIHDRRTAGERFVAAIAGAPGSGKSTVAAEVARRLEAQKVSTVVVPFDGFHLDNRILDERGLLARKGAPETFDADGFVHLIVRLTQGENVVYPLFDRQRDISIAGAGIVGQKTDVVIVEGNYLLFNEAPWEYLAKLWDFSVRIDVSISELRSRLIQRWLSHGLSRATATRRAEKNDLENARRILDKALPADLVI